MISTHLSPDDYCRQKATGSGSSFSISFQFLAADRRKALTALYAFCHEVDDIVDDLAMDGKTAREKLEDWRENIALMYANNPLHPVTKALLPHLKTCSMEKRFFDAIVDGMEMDLDRNRYDCFEKLEKYRWHVAGAVGILAAGIFGMTNRKTLQYAQRLALAFQLTNIIRDVGEDAARGRVYLPSDELSRFGVSEADLFRRQPSAAFVNLMQFQSERALGFYDEAFALLPNEDRLSQKPGMVMASIYRELLLEIRRQGFPVLTKRVSLPKTRTLWLAWKAWLNE